MKKILSLARRQKGASSNSTSSTQPLHQQEGSNGDHFGGRSSVRGGQQGVSSREAAAAPVIPPRSTSLRQHLAACDSDAASVASLQSVSASRGRAAGARGGGEG
eukprot:CAMPEP_0114143348 /NCGR_PEP_ID=MMETSP0043_2-20121206/18939_1 /TAXON_ID=464988 /ORGANISM="Hemiselmis andersenii, Strain CCMP644" /LENGTH=103 /DNA_ID=CAMNT_0001237641 /DNA_START=154 /DNA_END=461 /DNA_ORIENTATION=-